MKRLCFSAPRQRAWTSLAATHIMEVVKGSELTNMHTLSQDEVSKLRDAHEAWLRAQPGVVGTGIGLDRGGNVALKVFTNRAPAATRNSIHDRLAGIPFAIEEVGEIRKQPT